MSTARTYLPLSDIITDAKTFVVVSSVKKDDRFITKLRHEGEAEADGLVTEGSQTTLYVSTLTETTADVVITPSKWEFTLSEFPHPETGEVINLKWLRVKR
jgi:hypothetical protein